MPAMDKLGSFHTSYGVFDGVGRVTFRNTAVVVWTEDSITLNTGGWRTVTTKRKMNQASNQFGLGYQVSQKNNEWFITYRGTTIPFAGDVMTLDRHTFRITRAA